MLLEILSQYFTPLSWLCGIAIAHWLGWPRFPTSPRALAIESIVTTLFLNVICAANPNVNVLVLFVYASTVRGIMCMHCVTLGRIGWLALKPPPTFLLPTTDLLEADDDDDDCCPICKTYEPTHKSLCCNKGMCAQCINLFLVQQAKYGDECCWFCRQQQQQQQQPIDKLFCTL